MHLAKGGGRKYANGHGDKLVVERAIAFLLCRHNGHRNILAHRGSRLGYGNRQDAMVTASRDLRSVNTRRQLENTEDKGGR